MEILDVKGMLIHEDTAALREIQIRFTSDGSGETLSLAHDISGIMIAVDYKDILRVVKKERSKYGK